jgi:hypothetical protein
LTDLLAQFLDLTIGLAHLAISLLKHPFGFLRLARGFLLRLDQLAQQRPKVVVRGCRGCNGVIRPVSLLR